MLKPFQIRSVYKHGSCDRDTLSSQQFQGLDDNHDTAQGLAHPVRYSQFGLNKTVQLSAAQYDDLAENHPPARLTYNDDDDGEIITVGSSLELSQCLDEPIDTSSRTNTVQPTSVSRDDPTEMHLFDIRLSHSISDLWKRFEISQPRIVQEVETQAQDVQSDTRDAPSSDQGEQTSEPNTAKTPKIPSTENDSQPLLAAFESEIAKLLDAETNPDVEEPEQDVSPAPDMPPETSSERPQNPAAAFAHTVHNILDRAEMVRGELNSRLPEFERQLHEAQRTLPGQVGTTLQGALSTLETHVGNMASVLNNISATRGRRTTQDFQAQPCPAAPAVDGLRTMASDIGQMGQTLFAAFDHGFRQNQGQSRPPHSEDVGSTRDGQKEARADDSTAPDASPSVNDAARPSHEEDTVHDNERASPSEEHTEPEIPKPDATNPGNKESAPAQESPVPSFGPPYPQYKYREEVLFSPHPGGCRPGEPFTRGPIPIPATPPMAPMPPVSSLGTVPSEPGPSFWRQGPTSTERTSVSRTGPGSYHFRLKNPADSPQDESKKQKDVPKKTLFIGNVGYKVTEGMIRNVFNLNGFLVKVHLPFDSVTKQHAGFGYLEFATTQGAKAAMEVLQGALIDGHSINLEFSDSPPIARLYTPRQHPEATLDNREASPTAVKRPEPQDNSASGPIEGSSQDSSRNKTPYKIKTANFKGTDSLRGFREEPGANDAGSSRHSVGLLDQDNEDSEFSARYPSLLPGSNVYQPRSSDAPSSHLSSLSPRLEMSRFPPVSQLDAHILANELGETPMPRPPVPPKTSEKAEGEKPTTVPGSFPHDSPSAEEETKSTTPRHGETLRRANTVTIHTPSKPRPSEPRFPVDPSKAGHPLHRRATERPRQGHTHHHRIRAAPTAEPTNRYAAYLRDANAKVQRRNKIHDCVTALCRLGYGGDQDGSLDRMKLYAEEADGDVWEAIEMIEEERKAYAQRWG